MVAEKRKKAVWPRETIIYGRILASQLEIRHKVDIIVSRRVKLLGVAQYYIIYRSRDHTIGSHFVGQKKNEINRVTPISQHLNEVLRTRNSGSTIKYDHSPSVIAYYTRWLND